MTCKSTYRAAAFCVWKAEDWTKCISFLVLIWKEKSAPLPSYVALHGPQPISVTVLWPHGYSHFNMIPQAHLYPGDLCYLFLGLPLAESPS